MLAITFKIKCFKACVIFFEVFFFILLKKYFNEFEVKKNNFFLKKNYFTIHSFSISHPDKILIEEVDMKIISGCFFKK